MKMIILLTVLFSIIQITDWKDAKTPSDIDFHKITYYGNHFLGVDYGYGKMRASCKTLGDW